MDNFVEHPAETILQKMARTSLYVAPLHTCKEPTEVMRNHVDILVQRITDILEKGTYIWAFERGTNSEKQADLVVQPAKR